MKYEIKLLHVVLVAIFWAIILISIIWVDVQAQESGTVELDQPIELIEIAPRFLGLVAQKNADIIIVSTNAVEVLRVSYDGVIWINGNRFESDKATADAFIRMLNMKCGQ